MSSYYYVGVDVGTASVRAALVDSKGHFLKSNSREIRRWTPEALFYQQSSENIWEACCSVVKNVVSEVDNNLIRGIGFDATCSLVVLDKEFQPLTVSRKGEPEQNVVMWLDHRAAKQAKLISKLKHPVLQQYGGSLSLEQNPAKILWLKQNLDTTWWDRVGHFFDLPDYLTWRATGSLSRSRCSLVCKMGYESNLERDGWNKSFWEDIGLPEVMENDASMLGNVVNHIGQPCGDGLHKSAAMELGLKPGTAVSTSIIDAHCGAIGLLSNRKLMDLPNHKMTSRLSLICGTSSCHMAISEYAIFVPGVWGPLYSALLPGFWLNEGGQSATGELIDYIIKGHPASGFILNNLQGDRPEEKLNFVLEELRVENEFRSVSFLTKGLHVWPDFHGNRSPVGDDSLLGMLSGLNLSESQEDLAIIYLAVLQSLAYGTRHILEAMTDAGYLINCILMCGGLSKNDLFVQLHADATGLPVIIPDEPESVLLGGAILGATASGDYSLSAAMKAMGGDGLAVLPQTRDKSFHDRKYEVFLRMLKDQQDYKAIMDCIGDVTV